MSEANPKNWDETRELPDDGSRYSGLRWCAWARRYDYGAWFELSKIADADGVVSDHLGCLAKLVEVAGNIEHERVIVIDDEDHDAP